MGGRLGLREGWRTLSVVRVRLGPVVFSCWTLVFQDSGLLGSPTSCSAWFGDVLVPPCAGMCFAELLWA